MTILGVKNPVSPAPEWDLFRDFRRKHSALMDDLIDRLNQYLESAGRQLVETPTAVKATLERWPRRTEFEGQVKGTRAATLLQQALWVAACTNEGLWQTTEQTSGSRTIRVYERLDGD